MPKSKSQSAKSSGGTKDKKERALPKLKDKTSQKSVRPAKNVKTYTKTTPEQDSAETVVEQNIQEPRQKDKKNRVYSRSFIQFVSAMNYIIFFFGFCVCRDEPFARFHHNQALLMWITVTILYLSFAFIPAVNMIAIPFVIMFHILWMFAGIASALHGRAFSVPLLSKIKIIDWEKV